MEKTKGELLKESLFDVKKIGWEGLDSLAKKDVLEFSAGYIDFLNNAKTEREATSLIKDILIKNGFNDLSEVNNLKPNDKIFYINRDKSVYAAIIGSNPLEEGLNLIGAHIDSPRLDLKPNPLFESADLAFLKTHFYGGIKKYQWVNIPLSLHGVVVKPNGEKININIGEDENDPVFVISDLLPHLSREQDKKIGDNIIEAEQLNALVGSIPYDDSKISEKVKLNVLKMLNERYGIIERDLTSAELELVPALKARNVGFDNSMISSYGQDDRVCAYTALEALLSINNPKRTSICILADKEEIGSVGNTGMYSNNFDAFIKNVLIKCGSNEELNNVYSNSRMLSADVTGAYDPNFDSVFEKNNESFIGKGISLVKYTGSASKGGASDANAEFVGFIRGIFENNNIAYQTSEMGKIGVGGGGTIAYILANKGIDVIDCGVPVLSMHSPYEITSKFDVYTAYKAYEAFYSN